MINFAAPLTPARGLPPCTPIRAFLDVRPSTSVRWAQRVLAPPRPAGPAPSAGARGAALDSRRPGPFPAPPWPRLPCGLLTRPSCSLPSSTLLARGVPFLPPRPAPRPAPFRAGRLPAPLWRPPDWSAPLASLPSRPSDGKNFQTRGPGMGRAPLLLLLLLPPPWLFVPALRKEGESARGPEPGRGRQHGGSRGRGKGDRAREQCEAPREGMPTGWGRGLRARGRGAGQGQGARAPGCWAGLPTSPPPAVLGAERRVCTSPGPPRQNWLWARAR